MISESMLQQHVCILEFIIKKTVKLCSLFSFDYMLLIVWLKQLIDSNFCVIELFFHFVGHNWNAFDHQ